MYMLLKADLSPLLHLTIRNLTELQEVLVIQIHFSSPLKTYEQSGYHEGHQYAALRLLRSMQ